MSADVGSAHCPVCKRRLDAATADGPFCGPRCRLVDLGRWLEGDYRIPDPDAFPRDDSEEHDAPPRNDNFH